jgi:hypothetical protein
MHYCEIVPILFPGKTINIITFVANTKENCHREEKADEVGATASILWIATVKQALQQVKLQNTFCLS